MRKLVNNNIIRSFLLKLLSLISVMNKVIPKSSSSILIYAPEGKKITDNSAYLLEEISKYENPKNVRVFLPSGSMEMIGYYGHIYPNVKITKSLVKGTMYFIISKFVFYSFGTMRIYPSSKQKVVMMDHGAPLKAVGRAELSERKDEPYDHFSYVLVLSRYFDDAILKSYGCDKSKILYCGFPRNDFLIDNVNNIDAYKNKYQLNNYRKNIIWMPTFRSLKSRYRDLGDDFDYDNYFLPLLKNEDELKKLDDFLKQKNYSLTVKVHPAESVKITGLSNIIFVKNDYYESQKNYLYEVLPMYDTLISDYSSIIWDYILLDRPVIFAYNDKEKYKSNRGVLIDNYEKIFNNYVANTVEELINYIDILDTLNGPGEKNIHRIHQYPDNLNIKRLFKKINLYM